MTIRKPITMKTLRRLKEQGEKFAMLTAYDATFARLLDAAGVEVILVGDSLGMVVQGHDTTVPVTVDAMVYHAQAVARASQYALRLIDLPFMSYADVPMALATAARVMQEGLGQGVKLEGDGDLVPIVRALSQQGVPVCAHLGLRPQTVLKLGGYGMQGKDAVSAAAMFDAARALEAAGSDLLLLENVPDDLATRITQAVQIPVIGIGAGKGCDAQVLVVYDLLGLSGYLPPFAQNFLAGRDSVLAAVQAYVAAVKSGEFPPSRPAKPVALTP